MRVAMLDMEFDGTFDAVLWDLDGTLLDSIPLILESYRHTLEAHGLPPRTEADILSGLGTTLEHQFERWGYGDDKDALISTYVEHNLLIHDALVRPCAGARELVHDLRARGVPQGIVTSKRRRGGEMGLRALGVHGCFDVEIYGDEVDRAKPDPEPVRRALDGLGLEASKRITFVGDAIHDVEAGRAAGVHTIGVTWGAGARAELELADAVVDDSAALRRLLLHLA